MALAGTIRVCCLCGKDYEPTKGAQRFCSADCRVAEHQRRWREAMRERRGSFKPKPCVDCGTEIIGRALRCPECKKADSLRRMRENKARPESLVRANELRKARAAADPKKARADWAKFGKGKRERIKADPERLAKRREQYRKHAAKRRAEREAAVLASLGGAE